MDYDLNYEVPLSRRARLSPEGVPGRTGDSACARPCMWLDANTDALRPVLTGAFVVPVISTQLLDSRAPRACGSNRTALKIIINSASGEGGVA